MDEKKKRKQRVAAAEAALEAERNGRKAAEAALVEEKVQHKASLEAAATGAGGSAGGLEPISPGAEARSRRASMLGGSRRPSALSWAISGASSDRIRWNVASSF